MIQALIIGSSIVAGGAFAALIWVAWTGAVRRAERRSLASALTGEIVAVLQTIELENSDQAIVPPGDFAETCPPHLGLPRFTIYEANAGKLNCFAAPLPRKIAYFFDRMGALAQECGSAATTPLPDNADRARHLREMQGDLKATLDLADEILLDLRPLISPHTQAKHLV
jgi:hypothetical protein